MIALFLAILISNLFLDLTSFLFFLCRLNFTLIEQNKYISSYHTLQHIPSLVGLLSFFYLIFSVSFSNLSSFFSFYLSLILLLFLSHLPLFPTSHLPLSIPLLIFSLHSSPYFPFFIPLHLFLFSFLSTFSF